MAYVPRASRTGQGAAQVIRTPRADLSGLKERIAEINQKELEAIQAQQEAESMSAKADAYADTLLPSAKAKFKKDIQGLVERAKKGEIDKEDFEDAIDVTYKANLDLNSRMWDIAKNAPKLNESYVKAVEGGIKPATFGINDLLFDAESGKSGKLEENIANFQNSLLPRPKSSFSDLMSGSVDNAFSVYAQENTDLEIPEGADERTYKSIVRQDWGVIGAKQLAEDIANDPDVQYSYLFENYPERIQEVSQSGELPEDIYSEILAQAENSLKPRTETTEKKLPQGRGGGGFNFMGGGRGENNKFYFSYQDQTEEVPVDPLSEGGETQRIGDRVINVEAKSTNPYQDFRTGNGQESIRAALVAIKLDENGNPKTLVLTDEEEVPYKGNEFILDEEYNLTVENIKALQENTKNQSSQTNTTNETNTSTGGAY